MQRRRVDVDEQRAERTHALAGPRGTVAQSFRRQAVALRLELVGARVEPDGNAEEVLDHAIVEVRRDRTPLGVRRFDGTLQERGTLLGGSPQPACERARERQVHELQEHEEAQEGRSERSPQPLAAGRYVAEALVDLEQIAPAVGTTD